MNTAIIPKNTTEVIDTQVSNHTLGHVFNQVTATYSNTPYTWSMLKESMLNPQEVAKDAAKCLAVQTSTQKSKEAALLHDSFNSCWIDIDDVHYSLDEVVSLVSGVCLSSFAIYSSASSCRAKKGKLQGNRWRVIIPLVEEVDANTWLDIQKALCSLCDADKSANRVQQILFLPNNSFIIESDVEGQVRHYQYRVIEDKPLLDSQALPQKIKDEVAQIAQEQALKLSKAIKAVKGINTHDTLDQNTQDGISKINGFYNLHDTLSQFGYAYNANRNNYSSPNSTTGGYGLNPTRDNDERWVSFHGCDTMGKEKDGVCWYGDTFDVLVYWKYNGDVSNALSSELALIDPDGQNQRQRDYMKEQEATAIKEARDEFDGVFNLASFSISTRVKVAEMKKQMLDDVYILGLFALLGQISLFFAAPNTGKTLLTLKLLFDAVKNGDLKGEDIFYINADDGYKGAVTKAELCAEHGINMLVPGHQGFKTTMLDPILNNMVINDEAKGKVLVIDTLKKFSNLMDKRESSRWMDIFRQFTGKGGSVILLAHTNKKRDDDGRLVYQGTTDTVDDTDCAYLIDILESDVRNDYNGKEVISKQIMFENIKARGDVKQKATYSYEIISGEPYGECFKSIKLVDEHAAIVLEKQAKVRELLDAHEDEIETVKLAIESGIIHKTELIQHLMHEEGVSKAKAKKVLNSHKGDDISLGHRWSEKKGGDKNVRIYTNLFMF